jgi:hypothetical protein
MSNTCHSSLRRHAPLLLAVVLLASCGPRRLSVIGPVPDASGVARALEGATGLERPIRIEFTWELNESGSRLSGIGVARVEPPYRARLDLFLDNREGVLTAALVDEDLRLPAGTRDDILPPVDLMWGTLGVFRPMDDADLVAGERLEGGAERLRYVQPDGTELHYETAGGTLRAVELVEDGSVIQFVRVSEARSDSYPDEATYRNLDAFRELRMTRTATLPSEPFDPEIWDPR